MDYEIEKYYDPILKELFPYKKAINVNFATMTNWGRVPSAKEMIEEDSENTKIYIIMHVFKNVIENNREKFLKNVLKLKETLEKQDLKRSKISIYIYRGKLFKDIDVNWLMEATDWFSNDIDLMEDGYDGHAKYSRADIYQEEMVYNLKIRSKNYKKINSILDIQENCISKTGFDGYKATIEDIKSSYRNDYLITEEEINEWKKSKSE